MKILLALLPAFALAQGQSPAPPKPYAQTIKEWRKAQEDDLKKDEGWLSVAGLFWLHEGENSFGTDAGADVYLPAGTAPANAGTITRHDKTVTLLLVSGVNATVDGKPVSTLEMKPDTTGKPDKVKIGTVTFEAIERGNRVGIRLFDTNCKGRREFTHEKWFPIREELCIQADFVPYEKPKTIKITNVLGDTREVACPGYVQFTVNGHLCRLDAEPQGDGFFFNFRDATSGKTTYPAGRFLDAPKPVNGKVLLDFNKATNPPCAFTNYATCPLPPQDNHLDVAIEAGEKAYHKIDATESK